MTSGRPHIQRAPEPAELTASRRRFVTLSLVLAIATGAAAGFLSAGLRP